MIIQEENFRGKPILVIREDEADRYPFSFGLGKARKLLEVIEDIKAFVELHKGELSDR